MSLDGRSIKRLQGVHSDLARVISRAAELAAGYPWYSEFIVTEGLRTVERQAELVAAGASKTMASRHITGHAVDLAAKVGGEVRWDGPLYLKLAEIVSAASKAEAVPIVWGGAWIRLEPGQDLGAEQALYAERKRKEGKRPLIDGPHFELDRQAYPA